MQTETIDRLFLELSQFTTARTRRELEAEAKNSQLQKELSQWKSYARHCRSCAMRGDVHPETFDEFLDHSDVFTRDPS